MLAPITLVASIPIRQMNVYKLGTAQRTTLFPGFVIAFVALVIINFLKTVPEIIIDFSAKTSLWALLTTIVKVGMKTASKELKNVGWPAISLSVI